MAASRQRLDSLLASRLNVSRKRIKLLLTEKHILVDGKRAADCDLLVDAFSHIVCDAEVLQAQVPVYLMLHKPVGVVSATRDAAHTTVIDLLDHPDKSALHIAGRLDLNSSGLLLLTNDSRWSQALMEPGQKVPKVYQVQLGKPVCQETVTAFARGMHFSYEGLTTRPARLEVIGELLARVTLVEGRYHQIKRMFGRFRNPVLALHRISIGGIALDRGLLPGQYRALTQAEIQSVVIANQ